ncbi:phage tail protein I [Desulfovibrio ferrophilus]|uniref:Putative tail protein I n=1 Tax=Desulfovibrio ferrophilus TaxID=241368 RepID=A0A2Z6AYX5_9BACT|nr:phage tail protein I [Desulfovibrio ferrophilus]BBD08449.1 putative tail protein I [Desulfovibrio ferrophilus]
MSNHLLPPNSTPRERALSEACSCLSAVPVPIRSLWNSATCPELLLPWLAWALSVDEWDVTWSEKQKRATIAAAVAVHRIKGTRGALNRAISALGYSVRVTEWFEAEPAGDPFTFRLTIEVDDRGIDDALLNTLERVVNKAKNTRSHLAGITVAARVAGTLFMGGTALSGDIVTVSPWAIGERQCSGTPCFALATVGYDSVTINPLGA